MNPDQNPQNDNSAQAFPTEIAGQVDAQQQTTPESPETQSTTYPSVPEEPMQQSVESTTGTSDSDPDLLQRSQFMTLLKYDSLLISGIMLLIFHGFLTLFTTSVNSYDTAVFMRGISVALLAATPLLLGAGTVALIVKHQALGITLNHYTRYGLSLIPLAAIFVVAPAPMNAMSPILLLISIGLLLFGQTLPVVTNQRIPLEGIAKYALLAAGFLVAGIFGLIVSFIMYLIIDLKVCELSSSKCY